MSVNSPEHGPLPKRRSFKITTEFGNARQWRSRKNRPCDTCRKRKTACIIESHPPCRFCKTRGLLCQSGEDGPTSVSPPAQAVSATNIEPVFKMSPINSKEVAPGSSHTPRMRSGATGSVDDGISSAHVSPAMANDGVSPPEGLSPSVTLRSENDSFLRWQNPGRSPAAAQQRTPGFRTAEVPLHRLEDGEGLTAHCMGLCGEQDPDLLASFRSVIMNETNRVDADVYEVYAGDPFRGLPPVHFNLLHDEFQHLDNLVKAKASDNIETMISPHGPTLVRLYFKYIHPVYCVISKTRFLQAYAVDKLSIPASLRGAIYGMGSMFWKREGRSDDSMGFDQHTLFEEAQTSLQREFHAPNLWTVQACILLLHERPADNATFETPRTWVISAQALACAQMSGLHRDPTRWQIAPWEKKVRKKLWWATYITDIWSSLSHGNPPHIFPGSFTTPELDMEDLAFDEVVPEELHASIDISSTMLDISASARFFEMVKLTLVVHQLLDTAFLDYSYQQSLAQPAFREASLLEIKTKLENWRCLLPHCVTMTYSKETISIQNNGPLHLAYFAVKTLIFRALMSPATMSAKFDQTSSLRRYFDTAVTEFSAFTAFLNDIPSECLHGFWPGHARSQLILCGNFLIYLFLLAPTSTQVHATFHLLESFHESLHRLRDWADDDASIHLLRPVALRMDSFFTQAAQIMRAGARMGSFSGAQAGTSA